MKTTPRCACGKLLRGNQKDIGMCIPCLEKAQAQKREEEQARLTADCVKARQAGMSYGEYMERKARSESNAIN